MEIQIDKSVERFIESLEKPTIAKVLRTIDLLEIFGPRLGMPHSKKVTESLFELRIRGVQEVRIFYVFHRSAAVLLHSFTKKSQKTPKKEIRTALQRMQTLD